MAKQSKTKGVLRDVQWIYDHMWAAAMREYNDRLADDYLTPEGFRRARKDLWDQSSWEAFLRVLALFNFVSEMSAMRLMDLAKIPTPFGHQSWTSWISEIECSS